MGTQIWQYFPGNPYETFHSSQYVISFTDQNNIKEDMYTSQIRKNEYLGMHFEYPLEHSGMMFA